MFIQIDYAWSYNNQGNYFRWTYYSPRQEAPLSSKCYEYIDRKTVLM